MIIKGIVTILKSALAFESMKFYLAIFIVCRKNEPHTLQPVQPLQTTRSTLLNPEGFWLLGLHLLVLPEF